MRLVVTATCTTHHAGVYAEYAERYLGIADAPVADYDEWTLDGVSCVAYTEADPSKQYMVEFNPKLTAPLLTLSPDGILMGINAESSLLSAVSTVPSTLPQDKVEVLSVAQEVASDYFSEEFLRAGSHSKKAATAAEEIYDIREKRNLIASGEADFNPTDGEQLRLMLQRQDAKEAALKSLFLGSTSQKRVTRVFDFTPKAPVASLVLFRFSRHLGFVDADDMAGEAVVLKLTDDTTPAEVSAAPAAESKATKDFADVTYRVPGQGTLSVSTSKNRYFEQRYIIPQFGRLEHLKGELFTKKASATIVFDPNTGSLRRVDVVQSK